MGKIEILSTHNLRCQKFADVCRKIATSCPLLFLRTTSLMHTATKLESTRHKNKQSYVSTMKQTTTFLTLVVLSVPHRGLPPWRGGGAYAPMTQTIFLI